jgi:Tol biopolymer transport system component
LLPLEDRLAPAAALVSLNAAGTDAGDGRSVLVNVDAEEQTSARSMSADGRYVVFTSFAKNLTAEPVVNNQTNIFVRDRQTNTTTLVNVSVDGKAYGGATDPSITPDGRYVVFVGPANTGSTALAPGVTFAPNVGGNGLQVYVRDLVSHTTTLVTVRPGGQGTIGAGSDNLSYHPSIRADGKRVVFSYDQHDDEVSGDSNGTTGVVVRDLTTGTTTLISHNLAGTNGGNARSFFPTISADGQRVFLLSDATDLTDLADGNGRTDTRFR